MQKHLVRVLPRHNPPLHVVRLDQNVLVLQVELIFLLLPHLLRHLRALRMRVEVLLLALPLRCVELLLVESIPLLVLVEAALRVEVQIRVRRVGKLVFLIFAWGYGLKITLKELVREVPALDQIPGLLPPHAGGPIPQFAEREKHPVGGDGVPVRDRVGLHDDQIDPELARLQRGSGVKKIKLLFGLALLGIVGLNLLVEVLEVEAVVGESRDLVAVEVCDAGPKAG